MSGLRAAVQEAFSDHGALAGADRRFRPRGAQTELALEIAAAIDACQPIVAEAGTGVGKTYAYLVPALLSGGRVLISTATKSLQDQLFLRDLPHVRAALQVPVQIALLKGRGSYLCLHRLDLARQNARLPDRSSVRTLAKVEQWAQRTVSGDLAELDGLDERSAVIPLVTSTRENCLGSECPSYRDCHVMKARRDAMAADVVVVNHHLFFADLALRETGMAELLPSVDVVIFDEAHQLGEAGVQFLGRSLTTGQLLDFARDMLAAGLQHARGLRDWQSLASGCELAARELRLALSGPLREAPAAVKLRWAERAASPVLRAALERVKQACQQAGEALGAVSASAPDFPKLSERAQDLVAKVDAFAQEGAPDWVRWIDLGAYQARMVESPLDIRETMQAQMAGAPKAWVFTSATLGDDERLSWFTEPAGLNGVATLRVGSPFDYPKRSRVYVPQRFPRPNEPGHPDSVARLAAELALVLGGRMFVLTTTLRALSLVARQIAAHFEQAQRAITVLVQGQAPKRQLMRSFLAGQPAVLVGSQSFWEGIDVPGDALQCVVIDKLPFPPPNDPLVEARVRQLESQGRSPFNDYFLAEAAVALKQGAGRLIRSESDEGLLVICDPRMATMSYGRRLINALPPMTPLRQWSDVIEYVAELAATRASTTDRTWTRDPA